MTDLIDLANGHMLTLNRHVSSTSIISECGRYRYRLDCRWGNKPPLVFVMLNPSTADDEIDDPTIRRCIGFAKRESAGSLIVINLFALRATDPRELANAVNPFGPLNRQTWGDIIRLSVAQNLKAVCAWGQHKETKFVADDFRRSARFVSLFCLGKTKTGSPRHPLYVGGDTPLETFS